MNLVRSRLAPARLTPTQASVDPERAGSGSTLTVLLRAEQRNDYPLATMVIHLEVVTAGLVGGGTAVDGGKSSALAFAVPAS